MQRGKYPYSNLGQRLKSFRKQSNESLPEVSGAVELESDIIESYERGETRPSEDVLDLLINHFDIHDDEADELWELAGYGSSGHIPSMADDMPMPSAVVMVPMDNRVIYTDTANVTVNNFGVVMSFSQNGANGGQPVVVSRVGMSLDHAKSVLDVLQKTIKKAESEKSQKHLPDSKTDDKK